MIRTNSLVGRDGRHNVTGLRSRVTGSLAWLTCVISLGCGTGEESPGPVVETSSNLNGGKVTTARGEIGFLSNQQNSCTAGGYCTATMVDRNYIITASHCMGLKTGPTAGTFCYKNSLGNVASVNFDLSYAMGPVAVSNNDVGFLHLVSKVMDAAPAAIATQQPLSGTTVTAFGFGCQDRDSLANPNTKQSFTYTAGQVTSINCPVDSGGPRVFGAPTGAGAIFEINGGYNSRTGKDINGNAVTNGVSGLAALQQMGHTTITNAFSTQFAQWATLSGIKAVSGDFDGDGLMDIALMGGPAWTTVPAAYGNGDGTFVVYDLPVNGFATWAASATAAVAGDFNGDGATDIALVGGAGWTTVPIAFSNFDGTYTVTNTAATDFAGWAAGDSKVQVVAGDFNGDTLTDIALLGGSKGWSTIPIAFSNGDGSFTVTNQSSPRFAADSQSSGAKAVAGDFDGDGAYDLALTGGPAWTSIEVAFSLWNGQFDVTNNSVSQFPQWTQASGVRVVAGDFNSDGVSDLAAVGGPGWVTAVFAFSSGDGNFVPGNMPLANFPAWASQTRFLLAGYANNTDRQADLVLTGGPWQTIPVAFIKR